MAALLIGFAVVALLAVVAGELQERPWRRRIVDARPSRRPAPAHQARLIR